MNTTITAIVQLVIAAAQEAPEIITVIEDALAATKSGTGPTSDQIAAALSQAQANNAAIQSV